MRTSQAVSSLPSRQTTGASRILDTGTAFWASKTLLSAVELGVFTQLGPGPLPFEPLRQRLEDYLQTTTVADLGEALRRIGEFVGAELASFKRPDGLTILPELPVTAMYKVDKRALRERTGRETPCPTSPSDPQRN